MNRWCAIAPLYVRHLGGLLAQESSNCTSGWRRFGFNYVQFGLPRGIVSESDDIGHLLQLHWVMCFALSMPTQSAGNHCGMTILLSNGFKQHIL